MTRYFLIILNLICFFSSPESSDLISFVLRIDKRVSTGRKTSLQLFVALRKRKLPASWTRKTSSSHIFPNSWEFLDYSFKICFLGLFTQRHFIFHTITIISFMKPCIRIIYKRTLINLIIQNGVWILAIRQEYLKYNIRNVMRIIVVKQ